MNSSKNKLFILSAPSGAGKTTLKDLLIKRIAGIHYSISATTRPIRGSEVNGEHYFFYSLEEFNKLVEQGAFVEYNEVHGNLYGTPKDFVEQELSRGRSLIFDLDVFGKINFDKEYPEAVGILIEPPGPEELRKRLEKRKSDSRETIELRLKNSAKELDFARSKGKYEYTVINNNIDEALDELERIVRKELTG